MVIGFINDPYTAMESDGEAFVEIGVLSGSLQRDMAFQLSFSDESAVGKTRWLHNKFSRTVGRHVERLEVWK